MLNYICAALIILISVFLYPPHFLIDVRGALIGSIAFEEGKRIPRSHHLFVKKLEVGIDSLANRLVVQGDLDKTIDRLLSKASGWPGRPTNKKLVVILDGHDDTIRPIFSDLASRQSRLGVDLIRIPLLGYGAPQSVFNHPSLIDVGESHCDLAERSESIHHLIASFTIIPDLMIKKLLHKYDDVRIYAHSGGGFTAFFLALLNPQISHVQIQSGFYPSDFLIKNIPSFHGDCEYQKVLDFGYSFEALDSLITSSSDRISYYFSFFDPCCFSGIGSLYLYLANRVIGDRQITLDFWRDEHEIDGQYFRNFVER